MIAKHLELKNFMSFKNLVIDDFTPGLTLIDGRNGDGKTTIWDGPSWCLFGETVRGLKGDEVVNWDVGENCAVNFRFLNRGISFDVTRYRSNKDRDLVGVKYGNRLIVKIKKGSDEWETIEKSTVADTEKWLYGLIGIDKELYGCTVVFAQGDTFNFVSESDKNQKEILSKIRRVNFDASLKKSRTALANTIRQKDEIKSKIMVLESHAGTENIDRLSRESAAWTSRQEAEIAGLHQQKRDLKPEAIRIKKQLVELKDVSAGRDAIEQRIDQLKDEREKSENEYYSLKATESSLKSKLEKIKLVGATCDSCFQLVDSQYHDSLQGEAEDELAGTLSRKNALSFARTTADEYIKKEKEKLKAIDDAKIERAILLAKVDKIKYQAETIDRRVKEIESDNNPYIPMIAEAKKKTEKAESEITELTGRFKKIDSLIPYVSFWENAFSDSGMKSFIFDSMCGSLTSRANHYLGVMTGGDCTISFDTQRKLKTGELREKFECVIHTSQRQIPFKAYSGGQKTIISLAVDMALTDVMNDYYGSRFNFMVMDEQDMYLDSQARMSYLNLLKERAIKQRVFVVAHDDQFKSMFDSVIKVVKRNGFSEIES